MCLGQSSNCSIPILLRILLYVFFPNFEIWSWKLKVWSPLFLTFVFSPSRTTPFTCTLTLFLLLEKWKIYSDILGVPKYEQNSFYWWMRSALIIVTYHDIVCVTYHSVSFFSRSLACLVDSVVQPFFGAHSCFSYYVLVTITKFSIITLFAYM